MTCLTPCEISLKRLELSGRDERKRAERICADSLSLLHLTSYLHTTTMSSLAAFGSKTVARGVGRFTDLVLEKGSGAYITTDTGRQMMDFTSGIGVTNLGMFLTCSGDSFCRLTALFQQATATPK